MRRVFTDPLFPGAVAQRGERLFCKQEVGGSIPPSSTKFSIAGRVMVPERDP